MRRISSACVIGQLQKVVNIDAKSKWVKFGGVSCSWHWNERRYDISSAWTSHQLGYGWCSLFVIYAEYSMRVLSAADGMGRKMFILHQCISMAPKGLESSCTAECGAEQVSLKPNFSQPSGLLSWYSHRKEHTWHLTSCVFGKAVSSLSAQSERYKTAKVSGDKDVEVY